MKKRALQVSLVKKDPNGDILQSPMETIDPEQINAILKEQVQHVAVAVGAILVAKKAADTLSELVLIAGRKYI